MGDFVPEGVPRCGACGRILPNIESDSDATSNTEVISNDSFQAADHLNDEDDEIAFLTSPRSPHHAGQGYTTMGFSHVLDPGTGIPQSPRSYRHQQRENLQFSNARDMARYDFDAGAPYSPLAQAQPLCVICLEQPQNDANPRHWPCTHNGNLCAECLENCRSNYPKGTCPICRCPPSA